MGRTFGKRPTRNEFYIITNGKNTEYNYFDLLKSKRSIYDVKIIFENADPVGLVRAATRYLPNSNQVWIVFDIDFTFDDGRLVPAITEAERYHIKYAFSNRAFEVWLISHFEKCEREMSTDDHERLLNSYLGKKKAGLKYDKTDRELLKNYFIPDYKKATENAKVVYQKWMQRHLQRYGENSRPEIWKWNSCTSVYQLIEALQLEKP